MKDLFSRNYRTVKAVDDISFSVDKGEIVGFIEPNGAGKSTTIKILTGWTLGFLLCHALSESWE